MARAFKKIAVVAPHKYLADLRGEEAKRVMLTTKLPLADTVLICGFGYQSYFTRIFSRSVAAARARGAGTIPMDNRRVFYAGLIMSRA
ncbi:transcriptional regulator GlxA family with amidase domain [Nitrobacteraceae bacterium AZCC 1564]